MFVALDLDTKKWYINKAFIEHNWANLKKHYTNPNVSSMNKVFLHLYKTLLNSQNSI